MVIAFSMIACEKATPDSQVRIETTPATTSPTEPKPTDTAPIIEPPLDSTGYRVTPPMQYPDYTFAEEPSVMDLRLTAVRAAKDLLSIQWSLETGISYNKTGPVSNKLFMHEADVTYCGLLYSNASVGLFQFMEYYDQETGRLWYPGSANQLKEALGASCADAMIWGLTTVCTSIEGAYYPSTMVIKNGFYPLGGITYDETVSNFTFNPTDKIMAANGKEVVVEAYTLVQPGDMLVSTPDNHGMMAIENAHVVTNADGTIDMAKSYIKIQDQRGGQGQGFYEQEINGEVLRFSGRTEYNFTFQKLYEKGYIPVSTAEFLGKKDYEAATVFNFVKSKGIGRDKIRARIRRVYFSYHLGMSDVKLLGIFRENSRALKLTSHSAVKYQHLFSKLHSISCLSASNFYSAKNSPKTLSRRL